jgi:hypothetical protein
LDLLTVDALKGVVKALNDKAAGKAKEEKKPVPPPISLAPDADLNLKKGRALYLSLNETGFATAWGVTLAATGNRQKFTFASAAAPATTMDETDFGRGVSLTFTVIKSSAVFAAGASYERSYKGGKPVQICTPLGTTGSSQCSNAALTPPKESTDKLLFLEFRAAVPSGNLATSPRIEYKTDTSDFGIKFPIYFVPNDKRVLNGGLALGWTKQDHLTAGVFVGKAFAFLDSGK